MSYKPTPKQTEAWRLISGDAKHVMLFGGSRSGKTFTMCRAIALRAMAAPKSRHAILRFRFNHVKASVVLDTFPKMMELCFPGVPYDIDKTDWYAKFPNGSQIWFGGLDDKDRAEKILGQEYATIGFNECSQIPLSSKNTALTRLAQSVKAMVGGQEVPMRLKALYDENPPSQAHWSYKLFIRKIDPESNKVLANPDAYAALMMNPADNQDNLPSDYLTELAALPARMRLRFMEGKFQDVTAGALWTVEMIDQNRALEDLPDMQRIIVAVDPSGSGDTDNAGNDEIGIMVGGLGMDGRAYVLEDVTCKAGPKTWGNMVATAFDRHGADLIVGEKNFGGEMVKHVIQTAKPGANVKLVTASRGKAVRAEPISALTEQGKIRFAGVFNELEEELCSMTTNGYMGEKSPNRADAFVWLMAELFPAMVKPERKEVKIDYRPSAMVGW